MTIFTFILAVIALSISFYNLTSLSGKVKRCNFKQRDTELSLHNLKHKVTTLEDQHMLLDSKVINLSMTKKKGRPRKKVANGKQ